LLPKIAQLPHFIPSIHLWRKIDDILFYHSKKMLKCLTEERRKKYASELERKVSIYKRKKKYQGFCSGVQKMFGLFLFYHLSWFLAGPFY
jgi:hypothetical protein